MTAISVVGLMNVRAGQKLGPVQWTFLLGGKWGMEMGIKPFIFTLDNEGVKETADFCSGFPCLDKRKQFVYFV